MSEQAAPLWDFGAYHLAWPEPQWLGDKRRKGVRINELVRKAVMFLGVADDSGGFSPYGTGFLVGYPDSGFNFTYLVTCRHVVEAMREARRPMAARINTKAGA